FSFWIGMKFIDGTWIWAYDNSAVDLRFFKMFNWFDSDAHTTGFDCISINYEGNRIYLQEKQCSSMSNYICMGATIEFPSVNIEISAENTPPSEGFFTAAIEIPTIRTNVETSAETTPPSEGSSTAANEIPTIRTNVETSAETTPPSEGSSKAAIEIPTIRTNVETSAETTPPSEGSSTAAIEIPTIRTNVETSAKTTAISKTSSKNQPVNSKTPKDKSKKVLEKTKRPNNGKQGAKDNGKQGAQDQGKEGAEDQGKQDFLFIFQLHLYSH
ncbi:conserved oligomeric Golgi complex subunit 8, partial [Biomphalaria glabrata]